MLVNFERNKIVPILAIKRLGNRGRLLTLPSIGHHLPGQVIGLSLEALPFRFYSIASAPNSETCEILYTLVDDGALTQKLEAASPGDLISITPPRGSFVDPGLTASKQERSDPLRVWWIANGTGVAPFVSCLRHGLNKNRFLIHGVRIAEEAWYYDLISSSLPKDHYTVCASREENALLTKSMSAYNGRLTMWLQTYLPKSIGADDVFMLCGSDGMIVDVREILMGLGVNHERILSEIYF